MKVLILIPVAFSNNIENAVTWLREPWQIYKKNHLDCSVDLDFEYLKGHDIEEVNLIDYYYYSEQDIQIVKKKIQELIGKDEIIGLIIDPILTYEEEKEYMYNRSVLGNTLKMLFDEFHNNLPIFYYGSSIGLFFEQSICKCINENYRQNGYTKENGYAVIPHISINTTLEEYESMFNCLIDFYFKKQKENLKLVRLKNDN